ncbi:hypothetical protein AX14_008414 [Amanita brunnescens Koide BX004]|nr:hypothetical protein AX14_008414 [Amanita brunnescens Koide BX004]
MALAKERSKRRPLQLVGGEVGPIRQDSYRGLRRIPRDLGDGSKSFSDSVYSNVYLIVKVGRLETRSNPESLSKPTFKYDSYGEDQSESRGEPESLPARVGGTWKEIRHEET